MSIGIDFGIGIDKNSWYRTGIVSKPKKLVSPITRLGSELESRMGLSISVKYVKPVWENNITVC
jgi:hypothetical protein